MCTQVVFSHEEAECGQDVAKMMQRCFKHILPRISALAPPRARRKRPSRGRGMR